jgi:hypothetical protein
LAVAPAGIILLVNMYYYGGKEVLAFWLVVYLFVVLLYAARLYTLRQELRWQFGRIRFKPEIERDFLQIGAIIALAAVLFGTVVPTFAGAPQISGLWHEISRPVRSVEDTFSRLFSGLQPHGLPYTNPFGRTLALLGQRNLGTELVLEVRSPESRYWQGVIYNYYTGGAFQSSEAERVAVTANEQVAPIQFRQRDLLTQTVTVFFPNNTLIFAAPQPVAINQTGWLDQLPGGEFSMWTTLSPLGPGDTYRVVSSVSRAPPVRIIPRPSANAICNCRAPCPIGCPNWRAKSSPRRKRRPLTIKLWRLRPGCARTSPTMIRSPRRLRGRTAWTMCCL